MSSAAACGQSMARSPETDRRAFVTSQRQLTTTDEKQPQSMADASQQTAGDKRVTELFHKFVQLLEKKDLFTGNKQAAKVVDFKHPEELKALLPLSVSPEGCADDELLEVCDSLIDYSVNTSHPRFFNQLYNRVDPYGVVGSWMTDLLNTNEHTYEVAPVFILITRYLLLEFGKLLGYDNADIMFFPGGSLANFTAIHLARHKVVGDIKENGLFGTPRLTMFASEECHYSMQKAAVFMGFGLKSVISISTDDAGRMCPRELDEKITNSKNKGEVPFFVLATSGSTVIGAFDPLESIADVCSKHKIWMHVDGCWGGPVIFSQTHKHLVAGIERSDSACISLHKMMGAPIQCVAFLVNDKEILADANSIAVPYLFQPDKFYDTSYDMGTKTIQCGRRADSLKFWLMWKARGHKGFEQHVDQAFEKARQFSSKICERDGFRLVLPKFEFVSISFWYIPPSMRGQEEDEQWWAKLNTVAPRIKKRMSEAGSMMIGYQPQPHKSRVNFFRIIVQNPNSSEQDLDFAIDEIERLGRDL